MIEFKPIEWKNFGPCGLDGCQEQVVANGYCLEHNRDEWRQKRWEQGCKYKFDYEAIFKGIAAKEIPQIGTFRQLILNDLWFVTFFVLGIEGANHPFVVKYCREVEKGPKDYTVDIVAREHFKTTIITKAETIQEILRNPEERIAIFSHTRPNAKSFLRSIKHVFESSTALKNCFPEVLFANPTTESPKWSEDDGLIMKRKGYYNEATLEAWGLIEGMPTGKHFTKRKYDDVETEDLVANPETLRRLKKAFALSQNLGTQEGTHRVVGTPYHHEGVVQHIREMKDSKGNDKYTHRVCPATDDGSLSGKPVLFSEKRWQDLKDSLDEYTLNCQHLCNPTPIKGANKLNSDFLKLVHPETIPSQIFKFMLIDPAGDSTTVRDGDAWAIHLVGVDPHMDDIGASNVYLLDSEIRPMSDSEAIETIVRMYLKAGVIMQLGVEKVGLSTTEIHVANALAVKGRHISVDNGSLVILRPAGRKKEMRIQQALGWPLNNGKIHVSLSVPSIYRERFKTEMDKFPYWKQDGIDAFSYLYDLIGDYTFPPKGAFTRKIEYSNVGIV